MDGYKVVLLGSAYVGKSSMTRRFVYNSFNYRTESTIGASFYKKKLKINEMDIVMNIWDTSSNLKFSSLLPMYIRNASVVLLVYDITNIESFNKISSILLDVKRHIDIDELTIMLVGNKSELENRMVMYQEGKNYADQHNLLFMECSACTGENVVEIFNELATAMVKKSPPKIEKNIILTNTVKEKDCCFL